MTKSETAHRVVVICDGNSDDALGCARLAARLGNGSPLYPGTDFTTLKFGWRGQGRIPHDQLEAAYNDRYIALVAKLKELHELELYKSIVFLGVSASAHLAMLLFLNKQVEEAIAFDGILQGELPRGNNSRLIGVGLRRLSDQINNLPAEDRENINLTVVIPRGDNLIPLLQLQTSLPGVRTAFVGTSNHLVTTSLGLLRFVATGQARSSR